jgi:hypothetical protein
MAYRQDRRHASATVIFRCCIETAVLFRKVFHLPLRQTEGLMNSLARVMKVDIVIRDFSSITKRSIDLPRYVLTKEIEPGSVIIVDSTELKVYSKDEWHQESMVFRPGALGANCILPSMKSIRFWHVNSPRRKWATPQPCRIC